MLNEIHYLRTIKHDHIIHLTEVFENKRFIYVITPLCKGGDLKSFTQQEPLTEEQRMGTYLRKFFDIWINGPGK